MFEIIFSHWATYVYLTWLVVIITASLRWRQSAHFKVIPTPQTEKR